MVLNPLSGEANDATRQHSTNGQRMGMQMRGLIGLCATAALASLVSGCAGGASGDPGAKSLPMGQSCQTIRGELNRLDSRGVPALVERSGNGGKLNPAQRSEVDQYNSLLNQYLGARCHV